MSYEFRNIYKGVTLKGQATDPLDAVEGSLFHNNTDSVLKAYLDSAVRVVITDSQAQTLTNKTIDADLNTITNIEDADIKSGAAISLDKLATLTADRALQSSSTGVIEPSAVTNTELGYVSGVTSSIQTQIDSKVTGPASATDTAIAIYDGTTGKLIKSTGVTIDGSDNIITSALVDGRDISADGAVLDSLSEIITPTVVAIANNQTVPANVGSLIVDHNTNEAFKIDYSIVRRHGVGVGELDTAFVNNATNTAKFNNNILSGAIQSDGKIIVGGGFTNYAGTTDRNRLVRLNTDGTVDTTFANNASDSNKFNERINSIVVQSDGKILIGGEFTNYGLTGRNRLVRLNSDGTVDTAFATNASDGNKFSNSVINVIAVQSDGKILVGGGFTDYDGTTGRNRLIRLNSDGTLDIAFTTAASDSSKFSSQVRSIDIQSDGKILVGGFFQNYNGTTGRNSFIRLNTDGTLDTTFTANASDGAKFGTGNSIDAIKELPDGKIMVSGSFFDYNGTTDRNNLIVLNPNGTTDTTITGAISDGAKFSDSAKVISVQTNGKILVGGGVFNYNGVTGRNGLLRFNTDYTLDVPFVAEVSDNSKFNSNLLVRVLLLQTGGKLSIAGNFQGYDGVTGQDRLIRVESENNFSVNFVERGEFSGIYDLDADEWTVSGETFAGSDAGVEFSITNSGQVQYTSTNASGNLLKSELKYLLKLL